MSVTPSPIEELRFFSSLRFPLGTAGSPEGESEWSFRTMKDEKNPYGFFEAAQGAHLLDPRNLPKVFS